MSENSDDVSRRSRLVGIKLRALVSDHLGGDAPEASEFAPGASLRVGDDAWVFLDARPGERLGAALAWAIRRECASLHVVADSETGALARRAAAFSMPITVWQTDARVLRPAEPEALPVSAPAPAHHDVFRELIEEGGADPIVEHGVLAGEVRGLEVCRVVDDPHTHATRLEVGVGAHDREAFQMLHGDVPTAESLRRVVAAVAAHRVPGAAQHPLNRLGAERLIRWQIEQQPELVGATVVSPTPPPIPRRNLKDPVPCVATGVGVGGEPILVVCSSGVDVDVIPYATDARLAGRRAPGIDRARLVVAMPARDRIPLVDEIADRLRQPVEFVSVG